MCNGPRGVLPATIESMIERLSSGRSSAHPCDPPMHRTATRHLAIVIPSAVEGPGWGAWPNPRPGPSTALGMTMGRGVVQPLAMRIEWDALRALYREVALAGVERSVAPHQPHYRCNV